MAVDFPFAKLTSNELFFAERDERYRRLHEWPEPTYLHASGLRMIWRYDDVREVLEAAEPGVSNANSLEPLVGFRRIASNPRAIGHFCRHLVPLPAQATADLTDDTLHKRVWDTMAGPAGHFTISPDERPRQIDAMVEHFHHAVHDLGGTAGASLDVTALSISYAARVIGAAVGIPQADWPRVAEWSGAQSGLLGRRMRGRELAEAVGALGQLFSASRKAVEHSRRHRVTGFASRLHDAGLPRRVAVSAMANSLAAGVHTVSGSIQQGVQRLLSDSEREWWTLLADDTSAKYVAAKVLHLDPGLVAWKRRAVEPLTLKSGTKLAAGPVLVMFAAADRDPDAFPNPLALRGAGKLPLTFGFGRHVCPGKQLATVAVEVFLRELRELAPQTSLAEERKSPCSRKSDLLFSGADIVITRERGIVRPLSAGRMRQPEQCEPVNPESSTTCAVIS